VHDRVHAFYRSNGVNPGRSGCELAQNAGKMVRDTRRLYSDFFNPSTEGQHSEKDPDRLVFTMNATMSLNMIIQGVVKAGDHVVSSVLEHNSVIRPINHKIIREGIEATFISPDGEGFLDPDDIRRAIRPTTVLVIINHASNVTGVVQDIEAIGRICREADVPFAIDAAQTAGILPIDMAKAHIDFLAFTGHKSLFGPSGTGGLCVADDAEIACSMVGGTGVDSALPVQPEEFPHRLESGTINLAGIAGLNAGLSWILDRGIDTIRAHEMALLEHLQDGLETLPGVRLHGTRRLDRRVPTLSISISGCSPDDIGKRLDAEYGIQVRAGLQCAPLIHKHMGTDPAGTIRFSIGPFNTMEHIDQTISAVSTIAASH
ncbi:aminotransferase class V-fold PLP-dependent enzyme, partial [bacterium]|nr:aminotransferase class V-fold PLP-dependent enzyme [candidate division CSSED10-310 bacterium]